MFDLVRAVTRQTRANFTRVETLFVRLKTDQGRRWLVARNQQQIRRQRVWCSLPETVAGKRIQQPMPGEMLRDPAVPQEATEPGSEEFACR